MINKIKNALQARLTELEAKEDNIDILTRRLELIKTLLTINKSESERETIASKRGISIHTLNSVLYCQRKITKVTVRPVLDITHLAILNANKRDTNLSRVRSLLAELATKQI